MVFMAVSTLTRIVVSHVDVINVDEASYMVGASELLRGHVPYIAFGDNKPPLIYGYYALAQAVGGEGIEAVRLFTMLLTIPLTALAISAFYRHDKRGITGALLFLLYSASYKASDMLAVNCEVVMMLPLAWSLVMLRPGRDGGVTPERAFGAGLLIAVGALVKYQAALWAPAVAFAIAYDASRVRTSIVRPLVALALGLSLPVVATLSVFGLAGGLDGLIYWNVTHNFEYLQNPVTISRAMANGGARIVPFLAITAVLWYGWFRSAAFAPSRYWEMLVAGLIGASAAAACLGWRFFPHYFIQLYVPLAIAAAPWAASTLTWPMPLPGWAAASLTMAVVSGWTAANASRTAAETAPAINDAASAVAARIKSDACYGDSSLFVWGSAPEFYYHARLPLATQFFFPEFPLVRYFAGNPEATAGHAHPARRARRVRHWSRLMADLRRSRPTFVLDTAPAGIARWQYFPLSDYPMLHQFLERHYSPIDSVGGVRIYRRNDCESTTVVDAR